MRKALAATAALVAVTALALPWVFGAQARNAYKMALTRLQDQGARVIDSSYRRGWFSSEASLSIDLAYPAGPVPGTAVVPIRIESRISHGPWSLDSPRLLPSAALVESRAQLVLPDNALPALPLTTRVELDGSGLMEIRLPEVHTKTAGTELQTAQGRGELRFSDGSVDVAVFFVVPSLALSSSAGVRLELRGLHFEGAGARWMEGLATGEATLRLERAELRAQNHHLLGAGLSVTGKVVPDGELLGMELAYSAEDLSLNGAPYGPSQISLVLRRLPGGALVSLQRALRELSGSSVDQSLMAVATAAILVEHLPPLLAADPELALDPVEITTPEGALRGHLSIASQGLTGKTLEQRGAWIEHLVGEGDLSLSRPLALRLLASRERDQVRKKPLHRRREAPTQLDPFEPKITEKARERLDLLVRQKWLAESNGVLTAKVRLSDALLTVNGKTFPLNLAPVHLIKGDAIHAGRQPRTRIR